MTAGRSLRGLLFLATFCAAAPVFAQSASSGAVRFFGTGSAGQDRIRIRIDDNATGNNESSPADVGAGGFTVEFWLRGMLADNAGAARAQGSYADDNWIEGNIVVDRDIWGSGNNSQRDWGISIAGGAVAFGTGTGAIRIFDLNTDTVAGTFLVVTGIRNTGSEEGLLGLAFHPDYETNGAFYVYATVPSGDNTVRRYFRDGSDLDVADAGSAETILTLLHPTNANHNGGWIAFGPDDCLYIATGDGGGANDAANNAQNIAALLGKLLRILPGTTPGSTYTNPPSNPYFGVTGADEIWAYGLRNPWRCAFDRMTADLWIGDVGQSAFEEIDRLPAGASALNFGWPALEGFADNPGRADPHPVGATAPVADYGRSKGQSVTGGYVYRGNAISELQGTYFFADYIGNTGGNGRIHTFRYAAGMVQQFTERSAELDPPGAPTIRSISSFAEDAYGELYILDRGDGELFKIVSAAPWDIWRRAHFTRAELADPAISGAEADTEPDAADNLFEYVAGTDPTAPDRPSIIEAIEEIAAQHYLTLTFDKADVGGAIATGQGSADMGITDPWSAANAVVLVNTPTQLKIRFANPISALGTCFLRFVVTRQ